MTFKLSAPAPVGTGHARDDETLIRQAITTGPAAAIWTARQGLVVPRTYRRHPGFAALCADYAAAGWPVTVRMSGGGIVPQGPGILNVSLAYCVDGNPMDHSEAAYQLLCGILGDAMARLNVHAHAATVEGSFCDGRYNLAIGKGEHIQKVAGTAQLWRRCPTPEHKTRQAVLVHALMLVCVDIDAVTEQANAFEQALGTARRYEPRRAASLHTLVPQHGETEKAHQTGTKLIGRLSALLAEYIRAAAPPVENLPAACAAG